jgi:Lhr-like helicase
MRAANFRSRPNLADRVRGIISDPLAWRGLPEQVREWLEIQKWRSQLPGRRQLLVETFPRANKNYLICYLRGPARASDTGHAAHALSRTRAILRRQ